MSDQSFVNRYGFWQRRLYRLAFATQSLQLGLADFDGNPQLSPEQQQALERPVFIAALPRAGTTLLLNMVHSTGQFVTHTYRHLPFIHTPISWARFRQRFQRDELAQERAHGDNVLVDADSPEAFEEMVWRAFWASRYEQDRIRPWGLAKYDACDQYLRTHIARLASLEQQESGLRYLSKNNQNIARIPYLAQLFPQSTILIPFRNPRGHVQSLFRQHRNFLEMHTKDRFSRQFMAGIGHFDFGANHLPIDFDGWLAGSSYQPSSADYWLCYWTAAYTHLLREAPANVMFVDYDRLLASPEKVLGRLSELLQVPQLVAQSESVRTARVIDEDAAFDPGLLKRADELHGRLVEKAELKP